MRDGDVDLGRMAALSDGIFAVAMTLLVVALPLPKNAAELGGVALREHLLTLLPALRAILISFFIAAVFWRAHHNLLRCLARVRHALWITALTTRFDRRRLARAAMVGVDVAADPAAVLPWPAAAGAGQDLMATDSTRAGGVTARCRILLPALSLLALVAAPAHAFTCPASHPAVQVSVKSAEPAIDNTLPQPALQKLAGKSYHHGRTLGLYRASIRARWRTRIRQRDSGGDTCRWIDAIAIDLVVPERTIYIIRGRPPGTCWYDSVLAHERKHQAADDAVLAEFAPRLEQAVVRAIAGLPEMAPAASGDGAAMQRRLMAPVEAAVRQVLDALEAERRSRQAAIDTPLEYRRVGAACG